AAPRGRDAALRTQARRADAARGRRGIRGVAAATAGRRLGAHGRPAPQAAGDTLRPGRRPRIPQADGELRGGLLSRRRRGRVRADAHGRHAPADGQTGGPQPCRGPRFRLVSLPGPEALHYPAASPLEPTSQMLLDILFGLFGLAVLLGIAWVFSLDRRNVD